ncbi:hypothetical protein [Rhodopirellula bahusiensis]|uniref:hypothetical protein n=1 Tax=Rhodopirellula bahusiensis TaxID=2014065 RepID=UPI00130427A4|nr:hypothetical protein [Rhodopirellula bahusiensis]
MPQKKPAESENDTAADLEPDQTLFSAKFAALLEGEFLRSVGGHKMRIQLSCRMKLY